MKIVATTLREVRSASREEWTADSLDRRRPRVGRFYGLLTVASPEEAVRPGWGARCPTDDASRRHDDATLDQCARLPAGKAARIER